MYKKYSDDDLIRAYTKVIGESGQADKELLRIIEQHGGTQKFERKILARACDSLMMRNDALTPYKACNTRLGDN